MEITVIFPRRTLMNGWYLYSSGMRNATEDIHTRPIAYRSISTRGDFVCRDDRKANTSWSRRTGSLGEFA